MAPVLAGNDEPPEARKPHVPRSSALARWMVVTEYIYVMRITFSVAAAVGAAVAVVALGGASPAFAGSGWKPTGSMSTVHRAHEGVLLDDGRVLVASGFNNDVGEVPVAELYQPATGTWSLAAPPLVPRHYATATRLPGGRVLLAGGFTDEGVTNHAELYDPVANTWTATGPLNEPRNGHMAVLLSNGRVLVTGGADGSKVASSTAEIYDPATGTWSPAGDFGEGRENHQATLLADGRVLIAGGFDLGTSPTTFRASSAIYDPATNDWSPTAPMATARAQMKGGLLPDGTVLTAAGVRGTGFVTGAERFDPATNTWSPAGGPGITGNLAYGVSLRDGTFLQTTDGSPETPIYDGSVLPATDGWSSRYEASTARGLASLTLLKDGRVLMAGGSNLSSAEIFTPPTERGATGGAFGAVDLEDAVEQDVTLSNEGGNPLWIDGTDLAGPDAADFSVVTDGCSGETLEPTETCVIRVRFSPSAAGARAAELTVDDNAETSPAVELTGQGRSAPVDPSVDPPVDPPVIASDPPLGPKPSPEAPRLPAPCRRRFVTLAGIAPTSTDGKRVRLTGVAAASLAGKSVRIERNGRTIGTTQVAADGRIDATTRAPGGPRARRAARYRLVVADGARSGALKATRRVTTVAAERQADGRVRVTGRVRGVGDAITLTLRSDTVCGAKLTRRAVRTDRGGRFRITLAASPVGTPATIHRLWWGTRSVTLPIVATATD
jgi:hypothetical protein